MFFDDRLETVLRQRAESDVAKRTQFRQLLDLLGAEHSRKADREGNSSLLAAAWLRMDALGHAIPANMRARMIQEAGWRFHNPQLAAHLADFEPEVAAAALTRAQLSQDDWTALIPRLPVRARGFLRLRRDLPVDIEALLERLGVQDRGLPAPKDGSGQAFGGPAALRPVEPEAPNHSRAQKPLARPDSETQGQPAKPGPAKPSPATPEPAEPEAAEPNNPARGDTQPPQANDEEAGRSEISALVARIAQFKRSRETNEPDRSNQNNLMPRLPLGEEGHASFRTIDNFGFCADASGRIEWAETEVAAMVVGMRMVRPARPGDGPEQLPIERAFSHRQPITGGMISLTGAKQIVGDWTVDAQPRFSDSGHFAGYVGRFRRNAAAIANGPTQAEREADRIRQLLHELRTPVTAIQGYAEVIQQQLFGSAPHEYRALAAAIAADAARILAGFEELDRLARLELGGIKIASGVADVTAHTRRIVDQLAQVLGARMSGIEIEDAPNAPVEVGLAESEAETLLWRLLATLGGGCAAGEMINGTITQDSDKASLALELPASLLGEEDIFAAEARPIGTSINAGLFGAGFALRLVRAEARAAGGDLVRDDEILSLTLPLALALDAPTQKPGTRAPDMTPKQAPKKAQN